MMTMKSAKKMLTFVVILTFMMTLKFVKKMLTFVMILTFTMTDVCGKNY